ncbi:hypothetical protein PIROE2DRAFT_13143 [Piromyces sp. E2]|nr:hypothetical protein PIROE2DRAFT_13143 [Piromyces sp. E2]|eukprot:OUM60982.1 hypothetical protein PIROE2DRAFT_13143 [Piromyces sp. E2]
MKKFHNLYYIYILLFILYKIYIVNTKKVDINVEDVVNLENIITQTETGENIILTFNEKYYDMSNLSSKIINIYVNSNVTFSGLKDGTVFDFKNKNNGLMNISYLKNKKDILKFENIIFKNCYEDVNISKGYMFTVNLSTDEVFLMYENCTFIDNRYSLFGLNINFYKPLNPDYVRILKTSVTNDLGIANENIKIKFSYCNFKKDKGLFFIDLGRTEIDNCYFTEVDTLPYESSNKESSIFYALLPTTLILKNSFFENIKSELPLFVAYKIYTNKYIFVEDSLFSNTDVMFKGSRNKCEILNTKFENYVINKLLPGFIDTRLGYVNVTNTEFSNSKLMGGLFHEESTVYFQNITIKNISTNHKGLIYSLYNNLEINGLEATNITCYGESGDSSLILFDSNYVQKNLKLNDININNCHTNGPIIKIKGNSNDVYINKLNITNVKSYGPLLDNLSDNVNYKLII